MSEIRLTLDEDDISDFIRYLKLLLKSKELDKCVDGYKIYGEIEEHLKELQKAACIDGDLR